MPMTDNDNSGEFSLLNHIPPVLRARGYRLYAQGSRRLIDLWLNGGAAVLGHTAPNMLHELKNTASRGLYAPLPHFAENRFLKALSRILPNRTFRLYVSPPAELETLFKTGTASIWRPFADPASPFAIADNAPLIIPVLPGIQTWRAGLPLGLCAAAVQTGNTADEKLLSQLPPNDALSPVFFSVATRGIYNLLASPERSKPKLPRAAKAIQNSRWMRKGIYLYLKEKPDNNWDLLFDKFLEAGFLLPPVFAHPLILPGELSAGEEAKLASVLLI